MRTLVWASLGLLGGCFMLKVAAPAMGTTAYSAWYEVGPVLKPLPETKKIVEETVRRAGFVILPDDGSGRVLTDWQVELSAHWRYGYRANLEIELVKIEAAPGYTVRIRGSREINDDARNPSDPGSAQWIPATFDEKQKTRLDEFALKVHQILKFKLLEIQ